MKIGFTEQGDAGLDLTWQNKLNTVDGAILITKNANPKFQDALLNAHTTYPNKIILHVGCTGLGGTIIEPHVPAYQKQIYYIKDIVDAGFPLDHVVLRIDPIIPTTKAITLAAKAIDLAKELNILNATGPSARIRMSVYDEYKHVKLRLKNIGINPIYEGTRFYANSKEFTDVLNMLDQHIPHTLTVGTCAEPTLVKLAQTHPTNLIAQGCLSVEDLTIMNIDTNLAPKHVNGQNRFGCLCLTCKKELLTNKKQCPHKCVYCYWQN